MEDQTKSAERFLEKDHESNEIKNGLHKIKRHENKAIRDNLLYESRKQICDFRLFKTISSFGNRIYNQKIEIHESDKEHADLLESILNFNSKTKVRLRQKQNWCFDCAKNLYDGRELVLIAFKSGLFPLKSTEGTGLKVLTPKQMLEKLLIALPQVKADHSENLLNEVRQYVDSLYQSKEITKKVYNNIIKSIQI